MSDDKLKDLAKKFEEEEKLNTNPYQQPKESERSGLKFWLKTFGAVVLIIIGFYIFLNTMASSENSQTAKEILDRLPLI